MTSSGLPTSSLTRSTRLAFGGRRPSEVGKSPIGADGGFGPMDYDDGRDGLEEDIQADGADDNDDGFGDDFDEFEAGTGDDEFGDFDEGFPQTSEPQPIAEEQLKHPPTPQIPENPYVSSYTPIMQAYTHIALAINRPVRISADEALIVALDRFFFSLITRRYNRSHKSSFRRHIPCHKRRRLLVAFHTNPLRDIKPHIPNTSLCLPMGSTRRSPRPPTTELGTLPDSAPLPRLPGCAN